MPSSRGSFQPRDQTQVSHIAGRFFTILATREAQEYWSGQPFPSPGGLPDAGITPRSLALQADSYQLRHQGGPYYINASLLLLTRHGPFSPFLLHTGQLLASSVLSMSLLLFCYSQ